MDLSTWTVCFTTAKDNNNEGQNNVLFLLFNLSNLFAFWKDHLRYVLVYQMVVTWHLEPSGRLEGEIIDPTNFVKL